MRQFHSQTRCKSPCPLALTKTQPEKPAPQLPSSSAPMQRAFLVAQRVRWTSLVLSRFQTYQLSMNKREDTLACGFMRICAKFLPIHGVCYLIRLLACSANCAAFSKLAFDLVLHKSSKPVSCLDTATSFLFCWKSFRNVVSLIMESDTKGE